MTLKNCNFAHDTNYFFKFLEKTFEVLTCLHHPCQQLWLCHRQFRHVSFCDQCCKSQHMKKKCKTCDIKFRPIWNWSIKCRTCRGIDTKTYQKCSDSKRAFNLRKLSKSNANSAFKQTPIAADVTTNSLAIHAKKNGPDR